METNPLDQSGSDDVPPGSTRGVRRSLRAVRWRLRIALSRVRRHHEYQDERWDPLEIMPTLLTTTRVDDLPFPHHLFKCAYAAHFEELMALYKEEPGRAGNEFIATLTRAEASACPYHQADWEKVSALSVAVLARIQEGQPRDKAFKDISRRFNLTGRDRDQLFSLFVDPIVCGFDSRRLTNGQHRVCALKKAAAEFCVVER